MTTYKFETHINNGIIKLPKDIDIENQKVEITIVTKDKINIIENKLSVDEFVEKYLGTLVLESDDPKYDYLMEKYK